MNPLILAKSPLVKINKKFNRIDNQLYNTSIVYSEDMEYFLSLFDIPVDTEVIRSRVYVENYDSIINELIENGFLIDPSKSLHEQISIKYRVNNPYNTFFGCLPASLSDGIDKGLKKSQFGFFGIPYSYGSLHYFSNHSSIKRIREYSSKISYLSVNSSGKTQGWFDPYSNRYVFRNKVIRDYGDLSLTNNQNLNLKLIEQLAEEVAYSSIIPIFIGGDHSITYPLIRGYIKNYERMQIIHFDAHSDTGLSRWDIVEHGSFIRELLNEEKIDKIIQLGIRGPQDNLINNKKLFTNFIIDFEKVKQSIDNNLPTYLTVDCDVFDPSIFPGVTYSVPGGWLYQDFLNIIHNILHNVNIIAVDFVEFNSQFDFGNVSISTLTSSILDILAIVGERHG